MPPTPLPRKTPESQGVSAQSILSFLRAVEAKKKELHSFMLLRYGAVIAEGWWKPYRPHARHMLFSLSKSFASTAVGLAATEGRLSMDDLVLSFFPEDAPAVIDPNLAKMRIRHLLSMSTGHDQDATPRAGARSDRKYLRGFLSLPVEHEPGTHFVYNSAATYALSAIVQKLTGMPINDYLKPRLYDPLGIENPIWESSSEGINYGGWGLSITTEDIARFGQLYLQRGVWQSQRLLPESWIEEATKAQVKNGSNPESDWEQGYGYQFWRCRHGAYRADGAFGQFCVVLPDQQAVIAITAAVTDMQSVLNLVWDELLPAFHDQSLPANPEALAALRTLLDNLALPVVEGAAHQSTADQVSGKNYLMGENPLGVQSVALDFTPDAIWVNFFIQGVHLKIPVGFGSWSEAVIPSLQGGLTPVAASGAWQAPDTFYLQVRYYETPFCDLQSFQFTDQQVTWKSEFNVSFEPRPAVRAVGKLT